MKNLFLLALFACSIMASGQIMEEDTKVLSKASGEALFTLNAEQKVYSYEPEDGWYKIRKEVYVSPDEVVDDKYLNAGAKFYTKENEEIGAALAEVRIKEGEKIEAYRGKARYRAIVEGYVFKTKLKDGSVPEERVSELLAMKNRNEQVSGFEDLFSEYNFEERKFDDLIVYVMREENKTLKEDKDFRLMLVYRGESTVYAVITNDHEVTAPKVKMTWEEYDFKIIYFYKPTSSQEELIQDKILYTFMGL